MKLRLWSISMFSKEKTDATCKYNIHTWDNRRCVKNTDL